MSINIQEQVSLAGLTSFQVGGPAKYFVEVGTPDDVDEALQFAKEKALPIFILGGGSNLLVSDNGFAGLVIKPIAREVEIENNQIVADAGVALVKLVLLATENSLSGLEWALGVPGTIGGAVFGNAGCYGSSTDKVVTRVTAINLVSGELKDFTADECAFTYRSSFFKQTEEWLIWQVALNLQPGVQADIKALGKKYLDDRIAHQPKLPSAGCFFKNFTIAQLTATNPEIVEQDAVQAASKGGKLGCAFLLDRLGVKGMHVNGAAVSTMHANFIVNENHATAEDIKTLAEEIKAKAASELHVALSEEVRMVGF